MDAQTSLILSTSKPIPTYESLPNDHIRLLHVLPGKTGEQIECQLIATSIKSSPIYQAISYAWGDGKVTKPIRLNEQYMSISSHLWECLAHVRQTDKASIVWVDALCINQRDTEEKGIQITIMPIIYSSAYRTIIWLGVDFETNTNISALPLNGTTTLKADQKHEPQPVSNGLGLLVDLARNDHLDYSETNIRRSICLQEITDLAWWKRVWVVQETLLSASADLVLGGCELPWKTVFQAMKNFTSHATTCCRMHFAHELRSVEFFQSAMANVAEVVLSFQRIPPGTNNELLANIWMYRDRIASLHRDKVYGVLGLVRSPDFTFNVEYRGSYLDVCRGSIIQDIRASGNLHALRGIRASKRLQGASTESKWPSWVTSWEWDGWWAQDRARILADLYKSSYAASGITDSRIELFDSCRILGITGKVFDEVVRVSRYTFDSSLSGLLDVSRTLQEDWKPENTLGVYKSSKFNLLWRTLLADSITPYHTSTDVFHAYSPTNDTGVFKPPQRRATARDCFAFILWWICEHPYLFKSVKESHLWRLDRIPAVATIKTSILRATSGRKLFMTANGYIGLAPTCTEVGDNVAILLGGATPFMLRPSIAETSDVQPQYELLGDCYVHGCMDGELVKDADTDAWETLMLR